MNTNWKIAGALLLSGAALQAQDLDLQIEGQMQVAAQVDLAQMQIAAQVDLTREMLQGVDDLRLSQMHIPGGLSSLADATFLVQDLNFAQSGKSKEDHDYQAGTADLDANRFEDAVRRFDAAITAKSPRADGAYYWKAYAQNRLGHGSDALATIAVLRRNFPQSRWQDEAQALEVEINSQGGKANPNTESNEELKLIAINALMQSDPKQAIPILKKLLNGNQSPAIKDKAMFVLSQSGSPEARQTILEIARGSNPDLQLKAVRYISMMGNQDLRHELTSIYASSTDVNLKREIIRSYLLSGSKDQLLQAARSEPNLELRRDAIHTLAQMGGKDEIWGLYKAEGSPELKEEIVRSMLIDDDSAHLLEVARTEKDARLRKAAIRTLALTGGGRDSGALVDLYRNDTDQSIKRELIQGLFLQQNAKGLIELARSEKNPELKRTIVSQLALIQSKDATDYMLEILK